MLDKSGHTEVTGTGPLSAKHLQELSEANRQATKILGAAKVATMNGWTAGVCASLSVVFGMFNVTGLIMSLGLAVVAWNEFRGRNLLRLFDPRGARRLGWNQVGFIGLLVAYSSWNIYVGLTGPNPFEAYLQDNPELATMLGPIADLHTLLTLVVYGGVILLSFIFQGMNSLYYFRRGKLLETYLSQTPTWIVEMQGGRQRTDDGDGGNEIVSNVVPIVYTGININIETDSEISNGTQH